MMNQVSINSPKNHLNLNHQLIKDQIGGNPWIVYKDPQNYLAAIENLAQQGYTFHEEYTQLLCCNSRYSKEWLDLIFPYVGDVNAPIYTPLRYVAFPTDKHEFEYENLHPLARLQLLIAQAEQTQGSHISLEELQDMFLMIENDPRIDQEAYQRDLAYCAQYLDHIEAYLIY